MLIAIDSFFSLSVRSEHNHRNCWGKLQPRQVGRVEVGKKMTLCSGAETNLVWKPEDCDLLR